MAEFERIDVRELFRAHPQLHGQRCVTLAYAGTDVDIQIRYHASAPTRPQPVFVCVQCGKGARVIFGVKSAPIDFQLHNGSHKQLPGTATLVCRRCAKVDPDSHNLTGEQRSLRRSTQLRELLKGGSPRQKVKWQHWATYTQLCRELKRETQVRGEIAGLREAGVSRSDAERSAAVAIGTDNPVELSDRELVRALRALRRVKASRADMTRRTR